MEKDCIRLTSEEKERLIEFKKSDEFLKAYKLIKEEIGLKERKKLYFRLKVLFCLFLLVKFFPLGIYLSFFAFIIFMTYAVLKEEKNSEHDTNPREVTDFRGLLYGLILPHSYAGQLRVVPTKKSKFLKKEIQGRYLEALEGKRK